MIDVQRSFFAELFDPEVDDGILTLGEMLVDEFAVLFLVLLAEDFSHLHQQCSLSSSSLRLVKGCRLLKHGRVDLHLNGLSCL